MRTAEKTGNRAKQGRVSRLDRSGLRRFAARGRQGLDGEEAKWPCVEIIGCERCVSGRWDIFKNTLMSGNGREWMMRGCEG